MNDKRNEQGFTLVELLIVMIIIGILMAIAIPTLFGAKNAVKQSAAKNAAQSYQIAIENFRLDNGSRAPIIGNSSSGPHFTDWAASPQSQFFLGPLNSSVAPNANSYGKSYLRSGPPEVVSNGDVTFCQGAAPVNPGANPICSPANGYGALQYYVNGSRYRIDVYFRKSSSSGWEYKCSAGNTGTTTTC